MNHLLSFSKKKMIKREFYTQRIFIFFKKKEDAVREEECTQ